LRRGEAEILVHRQCRETDIGAVEIVDDISEGEERDDPPGNLSEYRFLLRIHLVASLLPSAGASCLTASINE
jgi:hypothetical protein